MESMKSSSCCTSIGDHGMLNILSTFLVDCSIANFACSWPQDKALHRVGVGSMHLLFEPMLNRQGSDGG
jgi:hypothetical protein